MGDWPATGFFRDVDLPWPNARESRLRVILNDRPLRQTLTGVGHYIAGLLEHVPRVDPAVQVDPFFFSHLARRDWRSRLPAAPAHPVVPGGCTQPDPDMGRRTGFEPPAEPQNGKVVVEERHPGDLGGSRKPWWLRRIMQDVYGGLFRRAARRGGLLLSGAGRYDVYHEPNHIPMKCDLPIVTTIHDLSVLVHPEWHPADRVKWYEREFAAGVRRTTRFIAASEFTKREMVRLLNVAPDRIDVTYQAPRPAFFPRQPLEVQRTLRAFGVPDRFLLYVGTLEPRKNVAGLLEAYAALPPQIRRAHALVIAGAWGWKQEQLREKLHEQRLSDSVRLLGYLHDPELACLYTACAAFVWPTLYEGFGLPPLEAMACGARVIVSNVASLPEVVGDAGVLVDPYDCAAWSIAMQQLSAENLSAATRTQRSLRQSGNFAWTECARQTAACYARALNRAPAPSIMI